MLGLRNSDWQALQMVTHGLKYALAGEVLISVRTTAMVRPTCSTRDLMLSATPRPGLMYQADRLDSIIAAGAAARAVAAARPSNAPPWTWPTRLPMCGPMVGRFLAP